MACIGSRTFLDECSETSEYVNSFSDMIQMELGGVTI